MIVFYSDLDNTLIYSYRRDIGFDKYCVEYHNIEMSFMTNKSYQILQDIQKNVMFVPVTTRTIEQYNRIDFGKAAPHYALVCNGGVLLVDGKADPQWYAASQELAADGQIEMKKAEAFLNYDRYRKYEVKNIDQLFLFTKSADADRTVSGLKKILDLSRVDVLQKREKVYVVPKKLDKGMAVKRFNQRINAGTAIAAGDSEFDLPMLAAADIAIAPETLARQYDIKQEIKIVNRNQVFSDGILEYISSTILV